MTEAIGPRSSCETSETKSARSAESILSSSAAALGLEGAHVLDRVPHLAPQERDQVDLVGRKGVDVFTGHREGPDRAAGNDERRRDARAEAALDEVLLLDVVGPIGHVRAVNRATRLGDLLEERVLDRQPVSDRHDLARAVARVCDHLGTVPFQEDEREAVEAECALRLAEEAPEGLVAVERRRQSPRAAVDGLELIRPTPDLVAQGLGLGRLGARDSRLGAQPVDEPPDDRARHEHDPDREGDVVEVVRVAPEPVDAEPLGEGQDRRAHEREEESASEPVPERGLDERDEEEHPDRRPLLEHEDEDVGADDPYVEDHGREPRGPAAALRKIHAGEHHEDERPDGEDAGRDPGPGLVALGIAGRDGADLDDRERHRADANPGDPEVGLALQVRSVLQGHTSTPRSGEPLEGPLGVVAKERVVVFRPASDGRGE
jgi:hypothetical protein